MSDRRIHDLFRGLVNGQLTRREFAKRAGAIGVSSTAIGLFLKSAEVRAQGATPAPGGASVPTYATPCAGDSCLWAGKSLTVGCIDASIKQPLDEVRGEFEAATGAKLTVVADPIEGAFPKLVQDQSSGTNSYNGYQISMDWLGELVEGDYVLPIDEWYNDTSGKFPDIKQTVEEEPDSLKTLRSYGGQMYVVPNDCDGQVLYYRRDLLTDENHQKAFKDEKGYDLPVPPTTWDQVLDIATYFNGKPNGISGDPVSGVSLHLKVGGQGMFHYASLSAPYVIGPQNTNLYWFDPENMNALVNSEGHLRAMKMITALFKLGPEAMAGWALGEAWDYFLKGNAVFTYSWGDVTPLAIQQQQPTVGKLGSAQLPGTMAYVDPKSGTEYKVDTPNFVGNATGGSWSGVVLKSAPDPDLVYYFWALMSVPSKQVFYSGRGSDGVDPGRPYEFIAPVGTADPQLYLAQGWNQQDAVEYCQAFKDSFGNPLQLPYLRIPGANQYWRNAMDTRLSEAVTGQSSPEDALKNMAADFEEITDQLGRDLQLESYKKMLGIE
jgi:multiple sugar transport system substrate-binding protein